VIGGAFQGGLGLPEREYYLKSDDKSKQLREAYTKHVAKMFELLGDPADQSDAQAAVILKIETVLATASMKNTDLRDPDKTYHKMTLATLKTLTPEFFVGGLFPVCRTARTKGNQTWASRIFSRPSTRNWPRHTHRRLENLPALAPGAFRCAWAY